MCCCKSAREMARQDQQGRRQLEVEKIRQELDMSDREVTEVLKV